MMVRPFAGDGVRVSIGEPAGNDVLLEVAARSPFRGLRTSRSRPPAASRWGCRWRVVVSDRGKRVGDVRTTRVICVLQLPAAPVPGQPPCPRSGTTEGTATSR